MAHVYMYMYLHVVHDAFLYRSTPPLYLHVVHGAGAPRLPVEVPLPGGGDEEVILPRVEL